MYHALSEYADTGRKARGTAVPVFEVLCDTVDVYSVGAYERTDWRIIRNAICNDN